MSTGVGVRSVMSRGLCTSKSSLCTSTDAGAGERLVEHVEVRAQGGDRPLVGQAEHVLDDPVVRHAQPEREPAIADGLGRQRLLGERDRVTRLHRHHRGADLDAGGLGTDERGGRERVEVVGDLRDPHRGEAGVLGPAGVARSRSTLVLYGPAPDRASPRSASGPPLRDRENGLLPGL